MQGAQFAMSGEIRLALGSGDGFLRGLRESIKSHGVLLSQSVGNPRAIVHPQRPGKQGRRALKDTPLPALHPAIASEPNMGEISGFTCPVDLPA
jgi:hypothetical protein